MSQASLEEVAERYARFCQMLVPPRFRAERYTGAFAEFEELCRHPLVAGCSISERAVHIGTEFLTGTAGGDVYDIGEFILTVSKDAVTWENITKTSGSHHAPCISSAKVLCGDPELNNRIRHALKDGLLHEVFFNMIDAAQRDGYLAPLAKSWPKSSRLHVSALSTKRVIVATPVEKQVKPLFTWRLWK